MKQTVTAAAIDAWLAQCRSHPERIACFVMGHTAPDTDAVVSALAEAARRTWTGEHPAAPGGAMVVRR